MTSVLVSQVRHMLVFVLPHEEYCAALGQCACSEKVPRAPGHQVPRMPDAMTLPALGTVEINDAVLSVADVQRAIRRGDVIATSKPDLKAEEGAPDGGRSLSTSQGSGETAPSEAPEPEGPELSVKSATEFAEVVLQTKPSPRARSKRGRV